MSYWANAEWYRSQEGQHDQHVVAWNRAVYDEKMKALAAYNRHARKAKLKAERAARGGLGRDWESPRWTIRERLAKWYAARHRSYGAPGGWIYGASDRPIIQGWQNYYTSRRREIWRDLEAYSRAAGGAK